MCGGPNAMAGTMDKEVTITRLGNDVACHIINLTAFDTLARCETLTCKSNGCVASVAHNFEYLTLVCGNLVACSSEGDPSIVSIDGISCGKTAPEIEEH